MPNPADMLLDAWTALSHKAAIGDPGSANSALAPTWVGRANRRRLNVYLLLWAYRKNAARFWLRTDSSDPDRYLQHREYGDAELIVQTLRAAVLGGEPRPLVDGADDDLPRRPTADDVREDLPEDPDPPEDGDGAPADPPGLEGALAEAVAEWETDQARIEAATARQKWIDGWWTDELADQKIIESEGNSVGLGDGVYELVWSSDKKRARLRIHDPGFYFPVHDSAAQGDDFPDRQHLAWEYETDDGTKYVRRITYERLRLVDVPVRDNDGQMIGFSVERTRRYPYAPDVDSEWTVLKTDATWRLDKLRIDRGVDSFEEGDASYAVNEDGDLIRELDLQQDYIPLVHIPNTPAITELWGESALLRIAQILDDLQATDTDLAASAALVAVPAIAMSGTAPAGAGSTVDTYGPGQIFRTGDGTMAVLDTSKSLDALIKFQESLFQRLSVNRQVPQSILGRVDLGGNLAGITLLLSFGPFRQYIEDLRLVRRQKYGLLLKFVQRMAISGEQLDGTPLDTNLAFGSYLPTDQNAVKDLVVSLVAAKLLSRATGMRLLQEAGVDIESIEDELDEVRRLDFEGAGLLADALASDQAAAEYLGRSIDRSSQDAAGDGSQPPAPNQPAPPGPPAPGAPPAPGGQPPTPLP